MCSSRQPLNNNSPRHDGINEEDIIYFKLSYNWIVLYSRGVLEDRDWISGKMGGTLVCIVLRKSIDKNLTVGSSRNGLQVCLKACV